VLIPILHMPVRNVLRIRCLMPTAWQQVLQLVTQPWTDVPDGCLRWCRSPQTHTYTQRTQVNQLLEVGDRNAGMHKYTAMDKWANQLRSIHSGVCNKVVS
jgi:hypothetical protein